MNEPTVFRRYLYNNEVIEDPFHIPPTSHFLCFMMQDDETILFAEEHKGGQLISIESFDTVCDSREKATETALLAEQYGIIFDEVAGVTIAVHRDPADFELGFDLPEHAIFHIKEEFTYAPEEKDRLVTENQNVGPYVGEIILTEPVAIPVKRVTFGANKKLFGIDYPFYGMGSHNQLTEKACFTELTQEGELWFRRWQESAQIELPDNPLRFVMPANQDAYLQPIAHHVGGEQILALDASNEPIPIEDLENHDLYRIVYLNAEGAPLNSRLLENQQLAEAEAYNVAREHHDFVAHAMLKQLQSELRQLAPQSSLYASHYVKIIAPLSQESCENIPLEPGQSQQIVSTYHFNGNLITCECIRYSEDGTALEQLFLSSPDNLTIYHRQEINVEEAAPI